MAYEHDTPGHLPFDCGRELWDFEPVHLVGKNENHVSVFVFPKRDPRFARRPRFTSRLKLGQRSRKEKNA